MMTKAAHLNEYVCVWKIANKIANEMMSELILGIVFSLLILFLST